MGPVPEAQTIRSGVRLSESTKERRRKSYVNRRDDVDRIATVQPA
jgi:hypothetical protein